MRDPNAILTSRDLDASTTLKGFFVVVLVLFLPSSASWINLWVTSWDVIMKPTNRTFLLRSQPTWLYNVICKNPNTNRTSFLSNQVPLVSSPGSFFLFFSPLSLLVCVLHMYVHLCGFLYSQFFAMSLVKSPMRMNRAALYGKWIPRVKATFKLLSWNRHRSKVYSRAFQ